MNPRSPTPSRRRGLAAVGIAAAAFLMLTPAAMASNVKFFQSPSHNIGCVIVRGGHGAGGGGARCDIAQHTWQAPPKPHSCDLDYGNGLEVDKHGKGHFVCAGDTVLGNGPVLNYGDSIHFGHYKCKSKTTGVRCRNRQSGHGFKISIAQAVRF